MDIRTVIVDDEAPLCDELEYLLQAHPDFHVVKKFSQTAPALEYISTTPCELVFLDIQMPGMNGIEFARCLGEMKVKTLVIFVTAYGEYALDAFDTPAIGYITKPVSRVALARTLEKAKALLKSVRDTNKIITVMRGGRMYPVTRPEIIMAYVKNKAVFVRTGAGEFSSQLNMQDMAAFLSGAPFLQVHRQYIVNLDYVSEVVPWFKGNFSLHMKGLLNEEIPVSRNHVQEVKRLLGFK